MKTSLLSLFLLSGCAHHPLDQFRELTGGERWDAIAVLKTKGSLTMGGMNGAYESVENMRDGRRRESYTLGPIHGSSGFDGDQAWYLTSNGELMLSDGEHAIRLATTETWMVTRGYWKSGGATYSDPALDDRGFSKIEAKPEGGVPIELYFDDSGLLVETRHRDGEETVITKLSDYRDVGGIRAPFAKVIDQGDPRNLIEIKVEAAELIDPADELFARPAQDDSKVSFTGAAKSTEIPFQLVNNHIYVEAQVDGKPVRFLVDTGGSNILTPSSAERLGIAFEGKMAASGVGEKKIDVGYARVKSLAMGEVRIADPLFAVIDLDPLPAVEGLDFDGLVGFEVFHRFAVKIDYPALRLTLIDKKSFSPPSAKSVKFELDGHIPIIEGEIDGIKARVSVDTGSRGSLSAHAPFAKKHDLVKKYGARFQTVTGWGVGGPLSSWPIRIEKLKMGDVELEAVLGDLYTGDKGAFASPDVDMNMGGAILRRFAVTFDYDARLMYLEPAPNAGERDIYDRAGVWIMRDGDKLEIGAVAKAGPAEKAGLEVGHRIVSIDGQPAASKAVAEWRAYFKRAAGTKIQLQTVDKKLELVLEDLVP